MAIHEDTLYAFIVEFSRQASVVSILGSWDNFQRPYPLRKDMRGGKEVWRTYSTFTGIVCDGDRLRGPEESRSGSLRTGGTYWYYYQINNDGEHCDRSKPTTRACPFLPGQEVNVLEVPVRVPQHSTDYLEKYTLDPETKYDVLPSRNKSPPHRPTFGRLNSSALKDEASRPAISQCNHRNIATVSTSHTVNSYHTDPPQWKGKRLPNLNSLLNTGEPWFMGNPVMSPRPSTTPSMNEGHRPATAKTGMLAWLDDASYATSRPSASRRSLRATKGKRFCITDKDRSKVFSLAWRFNSQADNHLKDSRSLSHSGFNDLSCSRPITHPEPLSNFDSDGPRSMSRASVDLSRGTADSDTRHLEGNNVSKEADSFLVSSLGYSNTTSTRSSVFYPSLALASLLTDLTCSSPITPAHSDFSFGSDPHFPTLEEGPDRRDKCYQSENRSVLTLRNVNKLPDDLMITPTKPTHHSHDSASKRVQEWSSTLEEPSSDLQDMCDDLGYLRAIIT